MTVDLCRDVERLIVEKSLQSSEMMYALYDQETDCLLLYLTRNMLDPEWYIHIHVPHELYRKDEQNKRTTNTMLCRNRRMMELFICIFLKERLYDVYSLYSQGMSDAPLQLEKNDDRKDLYFLDLYDDDDNNKKIMEHIEIMIATA